MSEELCWKCLQNLNSAERLCFKGGQTWWHCHHEPKEKPKCWCESERFKGFFSTASAYRVNYCPECGKKL